MTKEYLLKFYQKNRFYIFPIIVGLSSLILIMLVILPQTNKLLTNQKAVGEISKKSQFLEAKAQALEAYDPQDLKIKVDSALVVYPTDKDFASIVGVLQEISARSGFNITSLSLGQGSITGASAQSYSVKLGLLGQASALKTLFNNIEGSSRLMKISRVETTLGQGNNATASLTIEVLYAPASGDFGSVDSPLPELSQKEQDILARLASTTQRISIQQSGGSTIGPRGKSNPFE